MAEYRGAQKAIDVKIRCSHHRNMEFIYTCTSCKGEMACIDCVSSVHQGHVLVKLADVAESAKQDIVNSIEKAEKGDIASVQAMLSDARAKREENSRHFQDLESEITSKGDRMKRDIDYSMDMLLKLCKKFHEKNDSSIKRYTDILEEHLKTQQGKIQDCKNVIASGTNADIVSMRRNLSFGSTIPEKPMLMFKEFVPTGDWSENEKQILCGALVDIGCEVVSEFIHRFNIHCLEIDAGDVWIGDESHDIRKVSENGSQTDVLTIDVKVCDISISPVTGNLWLCAKDRSVREMTKKGLAEFRFRSKDPLCLAVISNESIIIGTNNKLIAYQIDGHVIRSKTSYQPGENFVKPQRASFSNSTGDIAVVDMDNVDFGGNGRPKVVVVDQKLKFLYQYNGPNSDLLLKVNFLPTDACFDKYGKLLVADQGSCSVLLVDQSGTNTNILYTDSISPVALCLRNDIQLWIGFEMNKVKAIAFNY